MEDEAALTTAILLLPYPWMEPKTKARCWRCGQLTRARDGYCAECGTPLRPELAWDISTRICPRCEKTIPLLAKFCPECGTKQ